MHDARDWIHAALTFIMAWLGLVLFLPGDSFDASTAFNYMRSIATEEHWALSFSLVSFCGFAGLVTNQKFIRLVSVLIVATMHGMFAFCLLHAEHITLGAGTYTTLAVLGYYLAYRRTREGL